MSFDPFYFTAIELTNPFSIISGERTCNNIEEDFSTRIIVNKKAMEE